MNIRTIVAALATIPPVTVDGQELTGPYLSSLVAINPHNGELEAQITPQLVTELGRMVAAAARQKARAELDYRIWRDGQIHRVTNDVAAASAAGFECAANPGTDAKGNAKEAKTPSATAAESWVRTLPEYREHNLRQIAADEAWAALHAAYEGAKARVWALREIGMRGGELTRPSAPGRTEEEAGPAVEIPVPEPATYTPGPPPAPTTSEVPADAGMKNTGKRRGPPPPPPIPGT